MGEDQMKKKLAQYKEQSVPGQVCTFEEQKGNKIRTQSQGKS